MVLFASDANNRAGRAGLDRPFRIGIDNSNIWVTQAGGRVTILHRNGQALCQGRMSRDTTAVRALAGPRWPCLGLALYASTELEEVTQMRRNRSVAIRMRPSLELTKESDDIDRCDRVQIAELVAEAKGEEPPHVPLPRRSTRWSSSPRPSSRR
jgi:hypothetical protein